MKNLLFLLAALAVLPARLAAQSYADSVLAWQRHYKEEFITEPRSPIHNSDTGTIRFFQVSSHWRVMAEVIPTPGAAPVDMATHAAKTKRFRQWASLRFISPLSRGLSYYTLAAYERIDPPAGDTASAGLLFIPFNDASNSRQTYGGGRYMDIPKAAVKDGWLQLDFNKAYNPWCAFGSGYSCPIPPAENRLPIEVRAGEMLWTKPE